MTRQGALLYPSLSRTASQGLIIQQRGLSLDDLQCQGALTHPDAAPAPTGGHPAPITKIRELQDRIRRIAVDAGYPRPLSQRTQVFDRPCGTALLESLDIVTANAADEGVWSFLTLVVVPEIGPWRFPDRHEDRLLGRPRNTLRRVWWRAWALGPDLDDAPTGCTPFNEDEFVQIMERGSIGRNRPIAKAVRDAIWRAESTGLPVARSEFVRRLLLLVRAQRSHISLDALTSDQLNVLLDGLAEEAVRSAVPTSPVPVR